MTYLRTEFLKGINPAQAGVNHPWTSLGPQDLDWQEDVRRHSGQVDAVLNEQMCGGEMEGKEERSGSRAVERDRVEEEKVVRNGQM